MPLSKTQVRYLRGLAHALNPVVMVGGKGVTGAVVKELGQALEDHELVKVSIAGDDRGARTALGDRLAEGAQAEIVQRIGKVIVLYRRHPEQPVIALPR